MLSKSHLTLAKQSAVYCEEVSKTLQTMTPTFLALPLRFLPETLGLKTVTANKSQGQLLELVTASVFCFVYFEVGS